MGFFDNIYKIENLEQQLKSLEQQLKKSEDKIEKLEKALNDLEMKYASKTTQMQPFSSNEIESFLKKKLPDIDESNKLEMQIAQAIAKEYESYNADSYTEFFEYQEYKSYGIEITRYKGFDQQEVLVPERINGKPVIKIGDDVFSSCNLKKVILPNTLLEIGKYAFSISKIENIILPNSLKTIECGAFYGCSLTEIQLPPSLKSIGTMCFNRSSLTSIYINVQEIPDNSFKNCPNLKKVTFGDKVKIINEEAFNDCKKLKYVDFGVSVTTVDERAFYNTAIETLVIPESLVNFGSESFRTNSLKNVVFMGKDLIHKSKYNRGYFDAFIWENLTVYCLPGSDAQKKGRRGNVRPLEEFLELNKS